jgi:hypothetical protein
MVTVVTERCTGRGPGLTGHVRSVQRSAPRVCERTLVWPDQRIRLVHLGRRRRAHNRRVRSLIEPERPVRRPEVQCLT